MYAWIKGRTGLRTALTSAAALLLLGGLTACSGLRDALGATKTPPDEFAVVTKAPLVIPPEFALRPPEPGAPRPQEATAEASAQQTVFGLPPAPPAPSAGTSKGEVILLAMAGADRADPNIRNVIESETLALDKKDAGFADRVLFWKESEGKSDKAVDAGAEAQRIRENEATGAPVTQGEAPKGEATESTGAEGEEPSKTEARNHGGFRGWIHEILPF
jgi:hypothetical protein